MQRFSGLTNNRVPGEDCTRTTEFAHLVVSLPPRISPTPLAACATNAFGELHVLAIDQSDGLWHTMRMADGSWPFGFGDVQAQTTRSALLSVLPRLGAVRPMS